jgi:hypothetical protein
MGDAGAHTLRAKLIATGVCASDPGVKDFLRTTCCVRWLIEKDDNERSLVEHFVISILAPEYND